MKATPRAKRYYRTLGLDCDASAEELREAYYRLAFTHHPDRNPGDAYAAARFKEIQVAYEWLTQRGIAPPPPTADQFPFLTPERSKAGLVWQRLAALAAVAAVAVTLTMLLRSTPRMGAAVKTESPRLEQLAAPNPIAMKLHQPVKIPDEQSTTARGALTRKSPPDNSPLQRSAADRPEWLAESWVGRLLESVEGYSPESFAAALAAVCRGAFSPGMLLTEVWRASSSWQGPTKRGLPLDPMQITWTVFDSSTQWTPMKNDQQVLIEDGMIRFGDRGREPVSLGGISPSGPPPSSQDFDSLEAVPAQQPKQWQWSTPPSLLGFAFGPLQPAARQLEPGNEIPGNWNGGPRPLVLQQPQPIEQTLPWNHESGKSGDVLQMPSRNRQPFIPDALSITTSPSYRGYSNPALVDPLEQLKSAVSSNAWKPAPLLPGQPGESPARRTEKPLAYWPLHETQQGGQSTDLAHSTATAEASNWGANSRQQAWPQSISTAGNVWDSGGIFTQNRIGGGEEDFSVWGREGAMANLGWNSQHTSDTSSNYESLLTRPGMWMETSFLSPTASKAGASRGPYRGPAAAGHRPSVPTMAPYGSGFPTSYSER